MYSAPSPWSAATTGMICSSGPTNTKNTNVVSSRVLSSSPRHMTTAPALEPAVLVRSDPPCDLPASGSTSSAATTPTNDSAAAPKAAATPSVANQHSSDRRPAETGDVEGDGRIRHRLLAQRLWHQFEHELGQQGTLQAGRHRAAEHEHEDLDRRDDVVEREDHRASAAGGTWAAARISARTAAIDAVGEPAPERAGDEAGSIDHGGEDPDLQRRTRQSEHEITGGNRLHPVARGRQRSGDQKATKPGVTQRGVAHRSGAYDRCTAVRFGRCRWPAAARRSRRP